MHLIGKLRRRSPGGNEFLQQQLSTPSVASSPSALRTEVPQGIIWDPTDERVPELDWDILLREKLTGEGISLTGREVLPDQGCDYAVARDVLEYLPDPIGSLKTWCTALEPGGHLYLVVSDKRLTDDRGRLRTLLEHLILDHLEPSPERDFEHYLDVAKWVKRRNGVKAVREAEHMQRRGARIRFHVFMPSDVAAMVQWFGENISPLRIIGGPSPLPKEKSFRVLLEKQAAAA